MICYNDSVKIIARDLPILLEILHNMLCHTTKKLAYYAQYLFLSSHKIVLLWVCTRSVRVYRTFRGISALISRHSCLNVRNIRFFVAQPFLLANQKEGCPLIPLIIPVDIP